MKQQKYLQTAFDKVLFNTSRQRSARTKTIGRHLPKMPGELSVWFYVHLFFLRFSIGQAGNLSKPTRASAMFQRGHYPRAVAVNPITNKIYVANFTSDDVTVIDGTNNSTITVAVGTIPLAVAVNPVTNKIYVANEGSNNVTVIDGANDTIDNDVRLASFLVQSRSIL